MRAIPANKLPYRTRIYVDGQFLLPANLVNKDKAHDQLQVLSTKRDQGEVRYRGVG